MVQQIATPLRGATGMQQKALPKKVDKVDRVSRFRNNISEDNKR